MKYLVYILLAVLPVLFVNILFSYRGKNSEKQILENLKKEHIVIKLPRSLLWLGFFACVFFCGAIILMSFSKDENKALWVYIGFALFFAIGVYLILFTLLWRIDIFKSKHYFIIRTALFRTHKIYYNDCVCYKSEKSGIKLKTKDKTFEVLGFANNFEFLLVMLDDHNVTEIK